MDEVTQEVTQNVGEMKTAFDRFVDMAVEWLKSFIPDLIGAILILVIGMWISKVVSDLIAKAMKRAKISTEVVTFVHSFAGISLKVVVVVAAVGTLGFNIASLVTALGAATVAIGLALQDTLKNVASGLMVLINKPFKVGDYVLVSGFEGTVTRIDISNTHLLTIDNKEIILPNSNITVNNITNYSSQENRRVDLKYSVAYGSDIDKVRKTVMDVVSKNKSVMTDPEPFFAVGEHCDSGVTIIVRIWCKTADYWSVYFYMQEQILRAFGENGIEIPFPQVDVHSKA